MLRLGRRVAVLEQCVRTFPTFSSNIPGPIFPLSSAPGVRARWAPTDALSVHHHGVQRRRRFRDQQPANTDWRFDALPRSVDVDRRWPYQTNPSDDSGLPGTFKLGGYYDTKAFADQEGRGTEHGD
jgi:hypothetical protein